MTWASHILRIINEPPPAPIASANQSRLRPVTVGVPGRELVARWHAMGVSCQRE